MKEQKFLIVDNERDINEWLDRGWEIISVTAQYVSAAMTGSYHEFKTKSGKFAIVLQKQNPKL